MTARHTFSNSLDNWLQSKKPKTIAGLIDVSGEKSFALIFLVLMAIPALPIPTGGITHVFEVMVMLLSLEMIIGRRTIWLPKRWLKRPLGKTIEKRGLPYLIKKVHWLEKYSRPRWSGLLNNTNYLRLAGFSMLLFALGAFFSPPFSGLDTIPAMGAVGVSLGLILGDVVIVLIGTVIGFAGIAVEIFLGAAVTNAIRHFF